MKVSPAFNATTTDSIESGIAWGNALKRLRERVWFRGELFPKDHSADYARKQLTGIRAMSVPTLLGWLQKVGRKYGTVAVIPIVNLVLSPLMLACHSVAARVRKAFIQEQHEACIAVCRAQTVVADAVADGHVDGTEERLIAEAIATAQLELDDLRISGRVE